MKQINQDNTMDVQRHLFLRRCFAYICCLLLCFITATTVYAQKVSVKGTVVDTNGDAIIGASVKVLKKSSVGTITDLDGNFTLSVPEDATKLEISFVGISCCDCETGQASESCVGRRQSDFGRSGSGRIRNLTSRRFDRCDFFSE